MFKKGQSIEVAARGTLRDVIDVWLADLDALKHTTDLLSADEQERAARFHFDRDRHRFAQCRVLLRKLIAETIAADAASLAFQYGVHGKPELAGVHFNVSHSANFAVIALSHDVEIGIDIEVIDPHADVLALARTAFSDAECAALASMPREEQVDAFFRGWTRKEAYMKLVGRGFSLPSDSFTVSLAAEPLTFLGDCALRDLAAPAGFACAIATTRETPPPRIEFVR